MTTEETHLDIENHTLMVNGERTAFALPNGTMIPLHPLVHGLPFEMQRLYAQTYANAYGDALKEQGAATFIQTQMSAALHEAGHVIVVASLGFNPTWSRIWAEPGGQWVGFTDADGPYLQVGTGSTADANITAAKGVMAGYIAERVFEGDDAKLGSSLDERVRGDNPDFVRRSYPQRAGWMGHSARGGARGDALDGPQRGRRARHRQRPHRPESKQAGRAGARRSGGAHSCLRSQAARPCRGPPAPADGQAQLRLIQRSEGSDASPTTQENDMSTDAEGEIVHGGVAPVWGDIPPNLQQMETTIRLPHGYSVDLAMDPEKGFSFDWKPAYPKFQNDRAKRKFWADYFKARDKFLQGCADTWQMILPLNAQDGLKFFWPGGGTEVHNLRADKLALAVHYRGGRAIAYVPTADIDKMIVGVGEMTERVEQVAGDIAMWLEDGALDGKSALPGGFVACLLWMCSTHSDGPELIRRAKEGSFYIECHLETDGEALAVSFRNGMESMERLLDRAAAERATQSNT